MCGHKGKPLLLIDEYDGVTMLSKTAKMLLGLSLLSAGSAMADTNYSCTHGKETRSVAVAKGEGNACEVKYTKGSETKTLWSAKHQASYCETRATEFTEKLKGRGFSCTSDAAAQPAAEQAAPAATTPAAQ
jgi:hypothetical protein